MTVLEYERLATETSRAMLAQGRPHRVRRPEGRPYRLALFMWFLERLSFPGMILGGKKASCKHYGKICASGSEF